MFWIFQKHKDKIILIANLFLLISHFSLQMNDFNAQYIFFFGYLRPEYAGTRTFCGTFDVIERYTGIKENKI